MKTIEIDDELYLHIVANTQFIGEDASSILRRLLNIEKANNKKTIKEKKIQSTLTQVEQNTLVSLPAQHNDETIDEPIVVNKIAQGSQRVFHFINKEELAMQRSAVRRFLLILAALYRAHPKEFHVVSTIGPKISGRKHKRLYFALSEALLTASGSSTKPKQVPQSPYWVITNTNTTRKKMMLTEAATLLGYNEDDVIEIRELL